MERTAKLKVEIDHYAFPSIDIFVEKHNRYSNWEARVAADTFLDSNSKKISSRTVDRRRKLKTLSRRSAISPIAAISLRLRVAKGFSRWRGRLLLCTAAWVLRISLGGKNARTAKGASAPRLTVRDVAALSPAADYVRSLPPTTAAAAACPKNLYAVCGGRNSCATVLRIIPISSERFQFSKYSRSHATRF